jgi:hypothetical protein
VAAVLEVGKLTPFRRLRIADYHIRRNYIAYRSHRKTRLKELRVRGIKPKFLDERFDTISLA